MGLQRILGLGSYRTAWSWPHKIRRRSFESIVMKHISGGEQRLIVDFSRLTFISSAGMRVLLIATKAMHASQGKIALCAMQNHIEEVFRISGFDRIMSIRDSRKSALDVVA